MGVGGKNLILLIRGEAVIWRVFKLYYIILDQPLANKYEVLIDAYVQSYAKLCKASECKAEIVQR